MVLGVNKQGQRSIELGKNSHTPESRLDVGGGINVAPGKLGKINKCRPPNIKINKNTPLE